MALGDPNRKAVCGLLAVRYSQAERKTTRSSIWQSKTSPASLSLSIRSVREAGVGDPNTSSRGDVLVSIVVSA
jgi:hypothetical protein